MGVFYYYISTHYSWYIQRLNFTCRPVYTLCKFQFTIHPTYCSLFQEMEENMVAVTSRESNSWQNIPVPILQSIRATFVDPVICIPSVLGLSSGEEISTLDTRTESEWEIIKCICWLFWIVRPLTLMAELDSIVSAYRKGKKREEKHQFYCILYDTNVQMECLKEPHYNPISQVCSNCQLLQYYGFLYEKTM